MSEIPRIFVEAYVETVEQARAAVAAGADRLELCGPGEGGLTPSRELVDAVLRSVTVPVHAMVRPRSGNFVYDEAEFAAMQLDITRLRAQGVQGLVFGVLLSDGRLDANRMAALVRLSGGTRIVCHRAFDATPDPNEALQQLVDLGVQEVLTSGHAPTALEGVGTLRYLHERAGRRIEILVGGGVRPHNVQTIVTQTGVHRVHARAVEPSVITGLRDSVASA